MTQGYKCWFCGVNDQQENSPYCATCESEHDLEILRPWDGKPLDITHYELEVTENEDGTETIMKYRIDETGRYFEGNYDAPKAD